MKPKTVGLPSIYDEKAFKKAGFRVDKLYLVGILVLLLVVIRFANLGLWWSMTYLELTRKPSDPGIKYTFLHLSNGDKALAKCRELSQQPSAPPVSVVGYFNLLNPAVFVVHNRSAFAAVDLGRLVVPLKPGTYTFTFYLSDLLEQLEHTEHPANSGKPGVPGEVGQKKSPTKDAKTTPSTQYAQSAQAGQTTKPARLGTSIFLHLLYKIKPAAPSGVSFILKTLARLKFLDIPYLVYFYLPMVLILIFNLVYSRAVLTAFFYYAGLYLLFDFKEIFFRVPFDAVLPVLGIKETGSFEGAAAVAIAGVLTMLGIVGLFSWKERRDRFKEGLIVLFFIFLPFFLRF